MATTSKTQCFVCSKGTSTFKCDGCSNHFCRNDLTKHLQGLEEELDGIKNDSIEFKQNLKNQRENLNDHKLIKDIHQWEETSIQQIKQTANELREKLTEYLNKTLIKIEDKLDELVKEIKRIHDENEFNEIEIDRCKEDLKKIKELLTKETRISIKKQSTSFINKIFVLYDTKWKQNGIMVAGGNGQGNQINQLHRPFSICIDDDQTLYIADHGNHRVVKWKSNGINGYLVAGGTGKVNQIDDLYSPIDVTLDNETNSLIISDRGNRRIMRWSLQNNGKDGEIMISDIDCWGLIMSKNGDLYVADHKKSEVRRWKRGETDSTLVAGGNGKGDQLNQLNYPIYIFVDDNESLYISDRDNHRVMKWLKDAKEGIVVAGGNGPGDSLTQLSAPQGVIIDHFGQIYVSDHNNHRVIRWCEGDKEGTIVIGGNGPGSQSNQLNCPMGLSFDQEGNLYVVDWGNNRVQKYEID